MHSPSTLEFHDAEFLSQPYFLIMPLNSHTHAYTTTVFLSGSGFSMLQALLNNDLDAILQWHEAHKMALDISESLHLVVNASTKESTIFKLGNYHLQCKTKAKLLGFHINNTLTWNNHSTHHQKVIKILAVLEPASFHELFNVKPLLYQLKTVKTKGSKRVCILLGYLFT